VEEDSRTGVAVHRASRDACVDPDGLRLRVAPALPPPVVAVRVRVAHVAGLVRVDAVVDVDVLVDARGVRFLRFRFLRKVGLV